MSGMFDVLRRRSCGTQPFTGSCDDRAVADLDDIDRGWEDLLGPAEDEPEEPTPPTPLAAEPEPEPAVPDDEGIAATSDGAEEDRDAASNEVAAEVGEAPAGEAAADDDDDDDAEVASVGARDEREVVPMAAEPRVRRTPAWAFAAIAVPVLALVGYVTAGDDPQPAVRTSVEAVKPTKERATASPAIHETKPATSNAAPAAEPPHPTDAKAREEAPPPAEAAPEESASSPTVPSFDPSAVEQHAKTYAAANEEYRASKSPRALETMALAACRMDDGAKARSAYRKMREREGRKKVFWECRATEIDLSWAGSGYTPGELVRLATRALDTGDAETALDLARTSNETDRSDAALLVMGRAYCALDRAPKAARLLRHLTKASRQRLTDACRNAGHEIADPG
jgi:hypothetical protein